MTHSALVADDAVLGDGVTVGPFAIIGVDGSGSPVRIGRDGVIRSHTVIYRSTTIGANFHAGHSALIRENSVLGDRVSIGSHSVIEHHVEVEDGVRIHSGCFVPEFTVLREGCWLGPGVLITNARFPNRPETKSNLEGVTVGAGAVIGAGAVLLPGVVIGERALVGAGAVVTHDVADGATVVGNPGRAIT